MTHETLERQQKSYVSVAYRVKANLQLFLQSDMLTPFIDLEVEFASFSSAGLRTNPQMAVGVTDRLW
jgi:hypothetical protein